MAGGQAGNWHIDPNVERRAKQKQMRVKDGTADTSSTPSKGVPTEGKPEVANPTKTTLVVANPTAQELEPKTME
jgi:hypothetical protein